MQGRAEAAVVMISKAMGSVTGRPVVEVVGHDVEELHEVVERLPVRACVALGRGLTDEHRGYEVSDATKS